MKVLTIILMALFTANLFGADFEEGKYYDRGKIEIPEKHPFYPVIQFINKIQEKKFEIPQQGSLSRRSTLRSTHKINI